ncbi:MAG: alpha/beta fold hydrolase, partial [Anaerolineae bacterium]
LVGSSRWAGVGMGLALLASGYWLLPQDGWVLIWTLLAGPVVLGLLLWVGCYVDPPPHPDEALFSPRHPAHGSCLRVQIPDGDSLMPGLLLRPAPPSPLPSADRTKKSAVCLIHGAGDTKTSFKWLLVEALLAEGLTVLTIDLPGHGEYRQRPLAYPDCLSAIPGALRFLREQPGVERVGVVGISLGSALALASLAQAKDPTGFNKPLGSIQAVAALETPIHLNYNKRLFYREMWHAFRAPVLGLLREITIKQMRQSWYTGGYVSRHKNTAEVIDLLKPLEQVGKLGEVPLLLVHGTRDSVAPPAAGRALQQAAPQATLIEVAGASHVTLTLMPKVNRLIAQWLRGKLGN